MIRPNNIYNMDCLEGMRQMEAESVDLTVTSPPYDNLRTYNGYCFDFENIARELYRVTKNGGVVVWVVGDATIDGDETGMSFRQALFFKEIGFKLHDTMIYKKSSVACYDPKCLRYKQCFEYMFVLSKGKPKTFNSINDKPVLKKGNTHDSPHGRDPKGNRRWHRKPYEISEYQARFNIWEYNVGNNCSTRDDIAFKHPAIFPERLAADHIKSWSNEGDIVLDPFMGSGTTAKVARALGRHYIGFEISAEYCDIIRQRLEQTKSFFTSKVKPFKSDKKWQKLSIMPRRIPLSELIPSMQYPSQTARSRLTFELSRQTGLRRKPKGNISPCILASLR